VTLKRAVGGLNRECGGACALRDWSGNGEGIGESSWGGNIDSSKKGASTEGQQGLKRKAMIAQKWCQRTIARGPTSKERTVSGECPIGVVRRGTIKDWTWKELAGKEKPKYSNLPGAQKSGDRKAESRRRKESNQNSEAKNQENPKPNLKA